ncbi:MAG TPA: HlyC/CorC family transporter [Caulobacteraceae bacterium]|nr:HlyC/CorC family transporter [Caulobacteraceae bacterium]
MTGTLIIVFVIILVLLSVSALFSAAETALTAASRGRMHQLEKDGDKAARRVNRLIGDRESMIGAVLLGYNLINILSSALATEFIGKVAPGAWGVVISTAIMTTLVLVFVEVLPKTLAITHPDDVARGLSAFVLFFVKLLDPIVDAIQWIVRRTLMLFGVNIDMKAGVFAAHEEIRGAVEFHHEEGGIESRDRRMLGAVLDLSEMDVSEVMVHRKAIAMLDADLPPRDLIAEALNTPHTRMPLFKDDPENIIGLVHVRDLLRAVASKAGKTQDLDIMAIARPPWFIPETTNLKDQLSAFLRAKNPLALVVDEYGALQGLVTLEDILEEIVGEIEDEYDMPVQGVRRQPDGSVAVNGQVTIRDLNRAMDWSLPDDDWVTVAGLVIHEAQTIPEPGQTFIFHGHRFQVVRRQKNQITGLRVSPPLDESETAAKA